MAEGLRKNLGYAKYAAGTNNVVRKCADTPSVGVKAPDGAYGMLIQVEAQNIRWRDDGTDPTATDGMLLQAGAAPTADASTVRLYDGDIDKFRWIEVAAGAIVHISYYTAY